MKILALDLSTKNSGYAIFDGQNLEQYGCISASSSNLYNRIDKMINGLNEILDKNKVDKIVIEEVILEDVKCNSKVFKALMYLQGFVMHLLNQYNITNIIFYTSSQWRKKCGIHTGRGIRRESLKPADIKFVKDQFGIAVNDDIADAICIGFAEVGGDIKVPQTIIEDDGFEFA